MDGQVDGRAGGWVDRRMSEQMYERTDGWVDRWMGGQMDG